MTLSKRNYLWDNMKAVLIILVVMGHLLEGSRMILPAAYVLDYIIYSYHMPAFLFVSGYLSKSYFKNGKIKDYKLIKLAGYYIMMQILFIFLLGLFGHDITKLSLLRPTRGLWYLLALLFYYFMIPIIKKVPFYVTIPLSILLSVIISFESQAGSLLSIHRIFVFSPFFITGYYTTDIIIKSIKALKRKNRILLSLICFIFSSSINVYQNIPIHIFFGKDNFQNLGITNFEWGTTLRLCSMCSAFFMILSLILIIPQRKTPISYIGENSLYVYLLHLPLTMLLMDSSLINKFAINTPINLLTLILFSILLSAIFARFKHKSGQKGTIK